MSKENNVSVVHGFNMLILMKSLAPHQQLIPTLVSVCVTFDWYIDKKNIFFGL